MGGKGRTSGDVQSICNLKTSFPTFLCRNQSLKTVIQQLLCTKGQWLWIIPSQRQEVESSEDQIT